MSRHESRQQLAVECGATEVLTERGEEAVTKLQQMFDGLGPDVVLECVGTKESMETALRAVQPGGTVGYVGVPAGGAALEIGLMFGRNVGVIGGFAYVRDYIPELLPDVLSGAIKTLILP